MAGSSLGRFFTVTTWGESHGKSVGVIVDGCPAGLSLSEEDIQVYLDQRRPGTGKLVSARQEEDEAQIMSGVFEGKTTGTPICILIWNQDSRSMDYSQIACCYRPGHADYTFDAKYGFRDYRGGGRQSGRETVGRVAGGAIAMKILKELGITVTVRVTEVGGREIGPKERIEDVVQVEKGNSLGGIVECRVNGLPAGLGAPVFDKLDAKLAQAVMSVGAVKGVEFGDGFASARSTGRENNDAFLPGERGIEKETNHAGGVLGGISDGSELILRAAVKPTPSIGFLQRTVNREGKAVTLRIRGRHDAVIVPRAAVVIQSMTALVLTDLLLENMTVKMDSLRMFYGRAGG